MFNVEFLHAIREFEYMQTIPYLQHGARILEIGGGTGYQAKCLERSGFAVSSIDVASNLYGAAREFPVQEYDGRTFPFPDASFNIVFSSNVLEHVRDLPQMHREVRRVLRPDGYCVHIMPTGSWRFWTNIAHYVELAQRIGVQSMRVLSAGNERKPFKQTAHDIVQTAKYFAVVPRHGESGNAFTEIITFGVRRWIRHFREQAFDIIEVAPLGLFYTGHMIFGRRLPIRIRQRAAHLLGSACTLYKVKPVDCRRPC